MKARVNLGLDEENYKFCKANHINMTKEFNDCITRLRLGRVNHINALNIDIKKKELHNKQKQFSTLQEQIKGLSDELVKYEKNLENAELEHQKRQKEKLEKLKHCGCCGCEISKPIEFRGYDYLLCINCLSQMGEERTKYLNGG